MKQFSIFMLLVFLFSSCGSLPHFEKRVYRSGFYFEKKGKVNHVAATSIIRQSKKQELTCLNNFISNANETVICNSIIKKVEKKKAEHFSENKIQRSTFKHDDRD